ncbi:MAG: hypothetical protein KDJ38_07945 [Gammaproteobacteria bacterium]|nr:hypothetical protein [Gammaproteobacteria bacterium]
MYKIRSVNHSTDDNPLQPATADELIDILSIARSGLLEFQSALVDLTVIAGQGPARSHHDFRPSLRQALAALAGVSYKGTPLFNGHLDVDIDFAASGGETVRVRIADLPGKFAGYHSNFPDLAGCDAMIFAQRIRVSAAASSCPEASIQGVRLNTFMPRSVRSSRLLAINSLSGLTGLYAMNYGNAIIAGEDSRETGMPLIDGCVSVNGVAIPASNGSVNDLVGQINSLRESHGVVAEGKAGQPLVLMNFSGQAIEIKITNQCAALLSGFPSGVTEVAADIGGLIAWISFRRLHEVCFDSGNTVRLLSGVDGDSVALKSGLTANLSADSLTDRRLALSVLQVMAIVVARELNGLTSTQARLRRVLDEARSRQKSEVRTSGTAGKGLASS